MVSELEDIETAFNPVWEPIAEYDMAARPKALLRDGSRQLFGYFGKPDFLIGHDGELELNTIGVLGWGELVDGDFIPRKDFEPSEFALVPENLTAAFAD